MQEQRRCGKPDYTPTTEKANSWIEQYGEEGCPVHLINEESYHFLQVLDYLELGILPEVGGLNDQYEYDLMMISIASSEKAACRQTQQ